MSYCANCGDTGYRLDGTRCSCGKAGRSPDLGIDCLTIPTEYRDIRFDEVLVPSDLGAGYAHYLSSVYDDVVFHYADNHKNIFIGAPPKHSKTILAYACIQALFRRSIKTFPLYDTGELWHIINDMDNGKKPQYLDDIETVPMNLYDAQTIFVKISDNLSYNTFDTISLLLDRRTRRGHGTIFICNYGWNYILTADAKKRLESMQGDGFFGTLNVHSFMKQEVSE